MDNSNPARKEPRRQPANPICPNFTLLNFLPKNSGIKPTNAPDMSEPIIAPNKYAMSITLPCIRILLVKNYDTFSFLDFIIIIFYFAAYANR